MKNLKKKWRLRKLVVFNSMLKNLQGLTLIDGLWQRINYTDIAEQRYGLYTFASKVVTLFSIAFKHDLYSSRRNCGYHFCRGSVTSYQLRKESYRNHLQVHR